MHIGNGWLVCRSDCGMLSVTKGVTLYPALEYNYNLRVERKYTTNV